MAVRLSVLVGATAFAWAAMLPAAAPPPAPPAAAPAPASYPALLVRKKAGETVDMGELRQAYAREKGYTGLFGIDRKAVSEALGAGRNEEALRLARASLADNFVDINAHLAAAAALRALGRTAEADAERAIGGQLLGSIFASGDGQSAVSAYHVISVDEEYIVLSAQKLRLEQQSLRTDGGAFDLMKVTDPATGEQREIWFDISAFFGKGF